MIRMVVDIRQRIGEDLYILFEEDKRKYDISAFDTLVGKYVYVTDAEGITLHTNVVDSQYIYIEENGNNYIEFVIGFPVNDFYSFKILDVADDFDRVTSITTMSDINPTTLNAEFDNIKDYIFLVQETMSNKMLKYDAQDGDAMIPKLGEGQIWSQGADSLEAVDVDALAYDDTDLQAEVDLNTAKVTNVSHPLVEKAVPSNALFTDTVYNDFPIQTEVDLNTAKEANVVHPLVEASVPAGAVFTDTVYDDSTTLKDTDTVSPVTGINKLITEADVTGGGDMTKSTYDVTNNGIVDNSEKVNSLTVETAVPSGALFTDTVYDSSTVDAHIADVTTNPHEVTLENARAESNILSGDINFNGNDALNLLNVDFQNGQAIDWNVKYHTINIPTGDGSITKAGIDTMFEIHNATGGTLVKGTVVYPTGTSTNGISNVDKAIATTHETLETVLGLIAEDVPTGQDGHVLIQGVLDPINTLGLSEGAVYLSGTVAGTLTNDKPDWTKFTVLVGIVDLVDASGVITVDLAFNIQDTITNFFNGIFRESFDLLVTSKGSIVIGTITPSDDNTNMTMIFNKGMFLLDTDPSATIALTAGTDTVPQMNYIYIPSTTKVLTVSTSGFPTNAEHIKVGEVLLQSATTVQSVGALKNQNFNDHVQSIEGQGHMSHITQRLRTFEATWESGTEGTLTGLPTNAYVNVTGGIVYQLHQQTVPTLTMPTDDINIVNHFTTPYLAVSDLLDLSLNAEGDAFLNTSYSIVVWGVANKTGEPSHIMANLPTGSYSKVAPQEAVTDTMGYSIYTIPREYRGVGFLIARFTFSNSSGVWTLFDTEDLRGKFANTSAGGGSGGGGTGVTTLLALTDTPSTFAGNSLNIARVDAGETQLEFTPLTASLVTDFDTEVSNNTDVVANTAKVTDLVHPLVETAVPVGALFTDTPYDDSDVLKDADTVSPVNAGNKLITQADVTGGGDMSKSTYDTDNNGIVDNSELVNNLTVETAVPVSALFTDTLYNDTAIQAEVDLNTAKVTDLVHPLVETAVPTGAVFTDTLYNDTAIQAEVDLNTAKVTDLVHPLVETAVPTGALFTDTTYTVQNGELSEVNFTTVKNTKLTNIEENANDYTHPANHAPSIITQDASNRFVTDAEKSTWNGKEDTGHSHIISDTTGLQTELDAKLEDAPSDGKQYAREDATWAEVTGGAGQGVPVGGTTAQVLAKASATDYDTEWVDSSGGGITSVPMEYCITKVSTAQILNTTGTTDMVFATAEVNSDTGKYTIVSGGVKVLQTGRYNISLQHSMTTSTTQRADPILDILVNGSTIGYASSEHYARATSGIEDSTSSVSIILDLTADDIVGMRLTRNGIDLTTVTTVVVGSWIEVTEHHGVKGDKGDTGLTGADGADGEDGSGLTDAPSDGDTYGREDATWVTVLPTQTNLVEIIVLTQSAYDALGSTPDTDNKLYIIRS
jgi:hypothetical protein